MRYRLRTLLILLAVGPPMLAGIWLYPSIVAFAVTSVLFLFAALLVRDWLISTGEN